MNVPELPQGIAPVRALDVTVGGAKATVPQLVNAEKNDRSRPRGLTRDNVGHAQVSFTVLWSDGKGNSRPPRHHLPPPQGPRHLLKTSRFSKLLPIGDETAATG